MSGFRAGGAANHRSVVASLREEDRFALRRDGATRSES